MIVALLLVLQTPVPLQDRIDRLHEDCRTATLKSLKQLVTRHKHDRSVVPEYFEFALPLVKDVEARDWVADTLLKTSTGPLRLACVTALGRWKHVPARAAMRKMLHKQLKAKKRDHDLILALARALRDDETFELLAKENDWRIALAAAHCLPKKLHPASAGIFLHKQASVLEAACAHASAEYDVELDDLARSGRTRVREAAAAALRRLKKSVPEPNRQTMPDFVHFVVDISGQMQWPSKAPTRMQVAIREVRKRIEKLPRTAAFNVFVFADRSARWKKKAVFATTEAKMRALAWIDARAATPRGGANTMLALGVHPDADEVVLVSAGLPSAGVVKHPAEVLIRFHRLNRFERTRVHTIAVTLHDGMGARRAERFMKRLAEWTGGTHRAVKQAFRDGR